MTNPQVSDAIEAMAGAMANTDDMKAANYTQRGVYQFEGRPCIDIDGAVDLADLAVAALAALEASGWAVVPVEASDAQMQAMCAAIENADMVFIDEDVGPPYWAAHWQNEARDAYRAMIAARPRVEG